MCKRQTYLFSIKKAIVFNLYTNIHQLSWFYGGVGQYQIRVGECGVRQSIPEWIQWVVHKVPVRLSLHVVVCDGWYLLRLGR